MEQKKLKFNIVDVVAVILIVAVVGFVGYKLANRGGGEVGPSPTLSVHYTVRCEGVDKELYESCKKHLPSQLMASGELYNGRITSVEQEDYYVLAANGEWVKDRDHVNLLFTVEATIPKTAVITTEIAKQEVRVGKSDYRLKSEYIEFSDVTILDVEWIEN